jgi:hypothetical protein
MLPLLDNHAFQLGVRQAVNILGDMPTMNPTRAANGIL